MSVVELCRALARVGHVERARRILRERGHELDDNTHDAASTALEIVSAERLILAPVVDPITGEALAIELMLSDQRSAALDDGAERATQEALRDAWLFLGGAGPAPRRHVHAPVADLLPLRLRGDSLYLATFLLAVARDTDARPRRSVVATGHPGSALGDLASKSRVLNEVSVDDFIAAGGRPAQIPSSVRFMTPEAACEEVFGRVFWHPSAPVHRKVVWANPLAAPAGALSLGGRIGAADVEPACRKVIDWIEQFPREQRRVELTMRVPIALAFALGSTLKPLRGQVRFGDFSKPSAAWINGHRFGGVPAYVGGLSGHKRIHVVREEGARVDGWDPLPIADQLADLESAIGLVIGRIGNAATVDLAIEGTLLFAAALGHVLRNRGHEVRFHQRVAPAYDVWHVLGGSGLG